MSLWRPVYTCSIKHVGSKSKCFFSLSIYNSLYRTPLISLRLLNNLSIAKSSVFLIVSLWGYVLFLTALTQKPRKLSFICCFLISLCSIWAIGFPRNSVAPRMSTDVDMVSKCGVTTLAQITLTESERISSGSVSFPVYLDKTSAPMMIIIYDQ